MTESVKYVTFSSVKCVDEEFLHSTAFQRAHGWWECVSGCVNCRLGADCLKSVGEYGVARYSVMSARFVGNSGGTTDLSISALSL